MKKSLLFFLAVVFSLSLKAQCGLSEAVDFTLPDVHGTQVHLFDILDGGQYVLIDFFFTTCGPCQGTTPKIAQSYTAMGCNMHDVFYMEVATGDDNAACLNWVDNYGIEYPTISGTDGGTALCSQYQIDAYPTVILIAPNRQIVINDLWPISTYQSIVTALEGQGLQQHACGASSIETVTLDETSVSLFPNPANGSVTLKGVRQGLLTVYNALGQKLDEYNAEGDEMTISTTRYENGVYFVKTGEKVVKFVVKH